MHSVLGRRRFIKRMLTLLGLPSLSGCDKLSQTRPLQQFLSSAERLNKPLHHWLAGANSLAPEFAEADISDVFPANGTIAPIGERYQRWAADNFRDWQLRVDGLVSHPREFSLADLRALPAREQITRHDCVEGWSAIARWRGVPLTDLLQIVKPLPHARFVVFHCADTMDATGSNYYESLALSEAHHPQTLLAYAMNGSDLPIRHGAPLRLRVERQLGYKSAKFLLRIELVDSFSTIAGGRGGYWEDQGYEWYAGI